MQITKAILAVAIAAAAAAQVHASTFTFATPSGATALGGVDPVSASALFNVSGNTLTITLDNLEVNPTEDAQVLDALTFQLNNQTIPNGASINLSMSETEFIQIGSKTTAFTTVSGSGVAWNLSDSVSGSTVNFDFCNAEVTGTNCTSTGTQAPEGGIIGESGSGNKFSHANSSLTGTANPYIYEDAVFTVTLSKGTFNLSEDNYTSVLFGFGTNTAEYEAVAAAAPEPSSFWMMAAALLLGLTAFRYRHKFRNRSHNRSHNQR